jgi:hypothetical protein
LDPCEIFLLNLCANADWSEVLTFYVLKHSNDLPCNRFLRDNESGELFDEPKPIRINAGYCGLRVGGCRNGIVPVTAARDEFGTLGRAPPTDCGG